MSMASFRDPTGLRRATTVALCAYIAFRSLSAIWLMIVMPGAQPIQFLVFGYLVSLNASYILALCWIYRVNANAHSFGSDEMTISPGWSVGWFFIPIANLVFPFRAMNEAWQASHKAAGRHATPGSPLVGWWWGLWIVNGIAASVVYFLDAEMTYASPERHFFNLAATALGVAGSLVFIQLMSRLDAAQLAAARSSVRLIAQSAAAKCASWSACALAKAGRAVARAT
jgi:hypothetical protein